jgi:transposase
LILTGENAMNNTFPTPLSTESNPNLGSSRRIVVGIDPGLDAHGVVILQAGTCARLERRMIPNTIAGMQEFVARLRHWQGQSSEALTIAMEEASSFGEALESYLSQEGFSVAVVSALKVARFKEALSADANDLNDAEAIARLVMVQPDLTRSAARAVLDGDLHGSHHLQLRRLSRRYERWMKEHTAACNELHAVLRMAWLADYQRFFSHVDGTAALAFWQQYPTPVEASQAEQEAIATLLKQSSHGRIGKEASKEKARDIHPTARLMVLALGRKNPNRWSAWAQEIVLLARHLVHLNANLQRVRKEIEVVLEAIESPLRSFKGIGPVIAAAIHGETLSVQRFSTAHRFARYNGTAPREDSSGRTPRFVKNHRCNRRLRQAFMQLALIAPQHQPASAAYMQHLAARGITGGAARVRLARRLTSIVFAMLRDRRPYDLELYMSRKSAAA